MTDIDIDEVAKRPGPDIHQVANEMAQQMTKKLFSGQALDQGQQAQNFKQGMNTQVQQQMLLRQLAASQVCCQQYGHFSAL